MKGYDFIFTGQQPWDIAIGSNAIDIALEVSKQNRVLYVNTPMDVSTLYKNEQTPENIHRKKVIRKEMPYLRRMGENLWVLDIPFLSLPINILPDGWCFDFINKLNNRRVYKFVKKIASELKFENYVLFIDNDIYRSYYANEFLKPIFSYYYRRDNLVSSYWINHAPRLEPQLCRKCDCVVANSEKLAEDVRVYNERSYDVGQGIDLSRYVLGRDYPNPKALDDIPRPFIGYLGWITSLRIDADLIYELAKSRPQYSFVLVGGEDDYFKQHPLHQQNNIYFVGKVNEEEVPGYIAQFDVCMNPQLLNETTIGNYPRKIDEYLALGKPTVATRTITMSIFDSCVRNCSGVEEYKTAIDEALASNSSQEISKRIELAHSHSWENSVQKIYTHFLSHIQSNK